MKIADISVSRVHSFIRLVNDRIVVEDNGSKFGTLVKVRRPTCVFESKSTVYQVGRSLVYFQMNERKRSTFLRK